MGGETAAPCAPTEAVIEGGRFFEPYAFVSEDGVCALNTLLGKTAHKREWILPWEWGSYDTQEIVHSERGEMRRSGSGAVGRVCATGVR